MDDLPHNIIGSLTYSSNGKNVFGTGILISPDLVLTVAHNIFDRKEKQDRKDLKFCPGQHGPLGKYYECENWYYPETFKSKNSAADDYAIIKLAEPTPFKEFLELEEFSGVQ